MSPNYLQRLPQNGGAKEGLLDFFEIQRMPIALIFPTPSENSGWALAKAYIQQPPQPRYQGESDVREGI